MSNSIPTWLQFSDLANSPAWLTDCRQQHASAICQHGLPTQKNERWKYADLSVLDSSSFVMATRSSHQEETHALQAVIETIRAQHTESIFLIFANGYFIPALSDLHRLPTHTVACSMQAALKSHPSIVKAFFKKEWDARLYPFASVNAASFTDGLFLYLPDHQVVTAPIHLLFIASNHPNFMAHPHHLFVLGERSKLILIEEYASLYTQRYFMNTTTHIVVQENAQLEQYKIQNESRQAIHIATTFIEQQQNSAVNCLNYSTGSAFARDDLIVMLQGQGAECTTHGFYQLTQDKQYIDHHVDIVHTAPHTLSRMLYKGTVDKKSRAVFNGRLHVEKTAQKIIAYQENHNLLLSTVAEVNSKPELEIYSDDVKCKHGATIGQINEETLFYLCSRGIPRNRAQHILLKGFADEVLQCIQLAEMKTRLQEWCDHECFT